VAVVCGLSAAIGRLEALQSALALAGSRHFGKNSASTIRTVAGVAAGPAAAPSTAPSAACIRPHASSTSATPSSPAHRRKAGRRGLESLEGRGQRLRLLVKLFFPAAPGPSRRH
jgi:hypothetical protein